MQVLWNQGPATVAEVVSGIGGSPPPAYNTVLTLLRILERKGYVSHHKSGRAFVYRPSVGRTDARHRAIRQLVARLFDGSPYQLVLNVLQDRRQSGVELDRLRRLVEAMPPADAP
jgi:predicted transcriptional regulator